jgi:hypothetical protein
MLKSTSSLKREATLPTFPVNTTATSASEEAQQYSIEESFG